MGRLSLGIVCFPTLGGSGVIASEIAAGLARRGHDVHLIASSRPQRDGSPPDAERFHPIVAPAFPLVDRAPYTLALANTLVELTRQFQLDLLQVHYAIPHAASALLARHTLGDTAPALIVSLHGTDVTHVGSDRAYRAVSTHAIQAADGITVPSVFLREHAHRQLQIPASRAIDVLPNFVDTSEFAPAAVRDRSLWSELFETLTPETLCLVHVSNFRAVKRPTDLIEVAARVQTSRPISLLLIGDGPARAEVEARVDALALRPRVRFLGQQTHFVHWLAQADCFLLTSESESFGVAALEALSCGIPVVAYRVGGLPEVIQPTVGRLVAPFDCRAMAEAVLAVGADPARWAEMSRAARALAESQFAQTAALDRYETYFDLILERRKTVPRR
jgi:N-acetyl-alpha-D-glucosaminyl L-malate synthase BshA